MKHLNQTSVVVFLVTFSMGYFLSNMVIGGENQNYEPLYASMIFKKHNSYYVKSHRCGDIKVSSEVDFKSKEVVFKTKDCRLTELKEI